MVLDTHTKGVDEDAEEDALLEDAVVHHGVETAPDLTEERTDTLEAGGETSS